MSKSILTPEAELSIISKSLKQTTMIQTGASRYYIIWGAMLFLFFNLQFLAFHFKTSSSAVLANISMLVFPVGGILSFIQSKIDSKKETIVPLNEKLYTYSWIGASICIGVLCISNLKNFIEILCIGNLVIVGLINFIIGGVVKFKPLVIGGIVSIALGVFIPSLSLEYKFLLTGIGILFSCLIPGLLMKKTNAHV